MTPLQKRSAISIIISNSLMRIGDTLSDSKTILTWLLSALGAPAFAISMLVPIRESGSMLPQIFISGFIKRFKKRKPVYITALVGQGISVLTMSLAALFLSPSLAGYTILCALGAFATFRAFTSVTSKDIVGRAIPKGTRGRLSGIASTISGILATVAVIIILTNRDQNSPALLAYIILGASALWFLATISYSFVYEPVPDIPSENQLDSKHSLTADLIQRISLIKNDTRFRDFIISRTLLLGTALASPVIVVIAQKSNSVATTLISFIIAGATASAISSYIWGRTSDRASHLSMALGGILAAITGIAAIIIYYLLPTIASLAYTWPLLFFVFNIGYTGVRLGRTTWVIDATEGDQRTNYVSASNTLVAILIIVLGIIASPLQALSPIYPIIFYTACCMIGSIYALRLKISSE